MKVNKRVLINRLGHIIVTFLSLLYRTEPLITNIFLIIRDPAPQLIVSIFSSAAK